jgi:hypothetical protein
LLQSHAAGAVVVDSAETTARAVAAELAAGRVAQAPPDARPTVTLLATDGCDRFRRVGRYFLKQPIAHVELVDL